MRDITTLNQLLMLANLESYNAILISQGENQKERMELLRQFDGTAAADIGNGGNKKFAEMGKWCTEKWLGGLKITASCLFDMDKGEE